MGTKKPVYENEQNENIQLFQGNIFETEDENILFGVNEEGFNDGGFAGLVTSKYWEELQNTGGNKLGEVLTKEVPEIGKTFHAIVCHSLKPGGWEEAPQYIKDVLKKLDINTNDKISSVLIGGGMIGKMSGANPKAILEAMKETGKRIDIYTL